LRIAPGKETSYGFFRSSDEVYQAWEETKRFAQALKVRVIVFQCPPSFGENLQNVDNMRSFFRSVRGAGFLFAWEPRGEWSEETIKALCSELGIIHCVDPLERTPLYGRPQYFRLHGGARYQHNYTSAELERLRDMVRDVDAYILFNNINMYHDALAFDNLIRGQTG
jgi:uncharacterized protein YecE (DUF72 family)